MSPEPTPVQGNEVPEESSITQTGSVTARTTHGTIHCITIVGQIEGHMEAPQATKTTKYEHIIPQITAVEEAEDIDGLLVLLNTVGGDVEAGLAIAELIAGMRKPTVSLVLGGGHSIGVPLAVSTNYSFIVPSGTMMIHPVRMSGMVIGSSQTYEYFAMIEDRILNFVESHARIAYDQLKELMHNTEMLTRDLGTVLVGTQAVEAGLINQVGGIKEALGKLYAMIDDRERRR